MAAGLHGSSEIAVLLIGGYSFLGNKIQGVNRKVTEGLEKTHGLGDAWEETSNTGVPKGTFAQNGAFFDDTTNRMHTALKASAGVSRVGLVAWGGNSLGSTCTGFAGILGCEYEVLGQLGRLTKANVTYGVSGAVEEGVLLQAHAALTANTTGTSVDNTAASTNGAAGYLEYSAFSGFTGVAVKFQHSTDNSSWSDITGGAFTSVTSAPGAQRIAMTGTINRYTRMVVTVTGSGSITVAVALARL